MTYCLKCGGLTTTTACTPSQIMLTGFKIVKDTSYNVSICKK